MRPSWNEYFMSMACLVAQRATCDRKKVGAIMVDANRRVVATGYNGAPRGLPHCDDDGHELAIIDGRESCIRTLHAESNALDYAGKDAGGCTLYVTVIPCFDCAKRIINSGIARVYYGEWYQSRKSQLVEALFAQASVPLTKFMGREINAE